MSVRCWGFVVLSVISMMAASLSARASDPEMLGTHGDWKVYRFTENGNQVCYMAATPQKAEGKYTTRGEVYALITHRPAENTRDVFSYIAGYSYKEGSSAKMTIDGKSFSLFTQDETAWGADASADSAIASAIRTGSKLVVKGVSRRGTETTDTFSLKGSSAAYEATAEACGL
ncbi:MAG: hypothetical protein J0L77_06595 [Alphaproteobacteria bacterium]|nr:hypothetical protein [Alphaproteobacteria bacterium]